MFLMIIKIFPRIIIRKKTMMKMGIIIIPWHITKMKSMMTMKILTIIVIIMISQMKSMMNIVIMLIMIFPRILAYGHHIQPLAPNQDEEYDNHPDSGEDHDEHDNNDDHDNNLGIVFF